MKTLLRAPTVLAIGILAASLPAAARTGVLLTVKVPFAFTVGDTAMPAGNYIVERHVLPSHVIIRNRDNGASVIMLVGPAPGYGPPQKARLVFSGAAGRYRLEQVWSADVFGGDQLVQAR